MSTPRVAQSKYPVTDAALRAAFDGFAPLERGALLSLRDQIFDTASTTPGVGALTETLKWNQPAYLTEQTKSGTTIRLGAGRAGYISVYTHCQTTVMSELGQMHPQAFVFEKNRAVHMPLSSTLPKDALHSLFHLALTYHQPRTTPAPQ